MNCEKCQELLSDLLDGTLTEADQRMLEMHLSECLGCANARYEMAAVISLGQMARGQYEPMPNPRAMWLRIQNIVETEVQPSDPKQYPARKPRKEWLTWLRNYWQVSHSPLAGVTAAVTVLAVLSGGVLYGLNNFGSSNYLRAVLGGTNRSTAESAAVIRSRRQQSEVEQLYRRLNERRPMMHPQLQEAADHTLADFNHEIQVMEAELEADPTDSATELMMQSAIDQRREVLYQLTQ